MEQIKRKRVEVELKGGVAMVTRCPKEVIVKIKDHDNQDGSTTVKNYTFADDFGSKELIFFSVEEGLEKIKHDYAENENTGGQYADELLEDSAVRFAEGMPLPLIMEAIQAFRTWDHDEDMGDEMFAQVVMVPDEKDLNESGNSRFKKWVNKYQDYCYLDGSFVPAGVRVGFIDPDTSELRLDDSILIAEEKRMDFAATPITVRGYFLEDQQHFTRNAMIGKWDGVSNDDDVFFWFEKESEIIGEHADFFIFNYC